MAMKKRAQAAAADAKKKPSQKFESSLAAFYAQKDEVVKTTESESVGAGSEAVGEGTVQSKKVHRSRENRGR